MMEGDSEKTVSPFSSPTTIAVIVPTKSGKSMFTKRLIVNASKMITVAPCEILYAYPEYKKKCLMKWNIFKNPIFHKDRLEEFSEHKKHSLLILDDLISKTVQSEELLHLFSHITWKEYFMLSDFTITLSSRQILEKYFFKHCHFCIISQSARHKTDSDVCISDPT